MLTLILCILICGGAGVAVAHFRKGSAAPGLANSSRGALYGAAFGAAFYFVSGIGSAAGMNQSTLNVKHINQTEFNSGVVQSSRPVVVDFYATWCGPCKILSPRLDKLAGSFTNQIDFVKINVDESPGLARLFDIHEIPTLMFFNKGKVVNRIVGLPETDSLKAGLKSLANPGSSTNVPE